MKREKGTTELRSNLQVHEPTMATEAGRSDEGSASGSLARGHADRKRRWFRILIADDHEAVRRGLRAALVAAGLQVCGEAGDGSEAIQKAVQLNPDLAILDVSMPHVGGLEAAKAILKSSPATKILIFTMHESAQIKAEAVNVGVHGMAVKSAPLSTLLATIDSMFESQGLEKRVVS
ncbi:MAG TPA: response regulator transcription factor [Candidatus Acidoferrum sp.]|nr:response regulator transcription factor [Candidatus Acidoferrum sp.]